MAVRQATRRYADIRSFLVEYPSTLKVGAIVLPAGTVEGEPAPEMKIDLQLPLVGRVGPLVAQVVGNMPDGSVALRVVDTPTAVSEAVRQLQQVADDVRGWLVDTRQLVAPGAVGAPEPAPAGELESLRARIVALERELASRPVTEEGSGGHALARPDVGLEGAVDPSGLGSFLEEPPASPEAAAGGARERGLLVPDLSGVEAAVSGSLEDRSLRDVVMALAVERQTGILTLVRPDGRVRWGFWSEGGPVGWRTEPIAEDEVLGALLYQGGTLTREQLADSLAVMERSGCRQGMALVEMGVLSEKQLAFVLQKQVEFVFQRALREREGTWTFHVLDALPESFPAPPLRVAGVLYRTILGHARAMPAQDLAAALRPWLDRYLVLAPGVEATLEDMRLAPEEQQFVKIIARTNYRLREIFAVTSLSRSHTAAAIWTLQDLNLLELREESTGVRERAAFEEALATRLTVSKGRTLFERIDVHWICTTGDVDVAYRRLKAEWAVDRCVAAYGEQHRAALVEVNASMDEAYRQLSNDALRREYRASVIERTKIEQSAELLGRQGEMAIMKAISVDAVSCYAKALELAPGNAEFRDGLNRARLIPRG